MFRKLLLWIFFLGMTVKLSAQLIQADSLEKKFGDLATYLWERDHDSSYVQAFPDFYSIRLLALNKYTFFTVNDRNQSTALTYDPGVGINLGAGFSNNVLSLDFSGNLPIAGRDIENQNFLDIQASVFLTKFIMEGTLKYFKGQRIAGFRNLDRNLIGEERERPDLRTSTIWLQFLYAFNYDRFSIKAPFSFSEIQKKSAGSWIFGASFNSFLMSADSSVVPEVYKPFFDESLHLTGAYNLNLNIHFGYMYSLVVKSFFLTLGAVPGIGINGGDFKDDVTRSLPLELTPVIKTIGAIGYNRRRYYIGIQTFGDFNLLTYNESRFFFTGQSKAKFFVGYRILRRKYRKKGE